MARGVDDPVLSDRILAVVRARLKAETIHFAATHALSQTFFPDWIRTAESADAAIQLVAANFGGCEKILTTPLPRVYSIQIRRFIFLEIGWLPGCKRRAQEQHKCTPPGLVHTVAIISHLW